MNAFLNLAGLHNRAGLPGKSNVNWILGKAMGRKDDLCDFSQMFQPESLLKYGARTYCPI